MSRLTHLKIKIKNLAAESGIIRLEERKTLKRILNLKELVQNGSSTVEHNGFVVNSSEVATLALFGFQSLSEHRRGIVRSVARINLLAYGFLRGREYVEMEARCHEAPNFDEVEKIARRFSVGSQMDAWKAWRDRAEAHLEAQSERNLKEAC